MYCMLIFFAYMYKNSSYRYRYYMIVSIVYKHVIAIYVYVTSCDCPGAPRPQSHHGQQQHDGPGWFVTPTILVYLDGEFQASLENK